MPGNFSATWWTYVCKTAREKERGFKLRLYNHFAARVYISPFPFKRLANKYRCQALIKIHCAIKYRFDDQIAVRIDVTILLSDNNFCQAIRKNVSEIKARLNCQPPILVGVLPFLTVK